MVHRIANETGLDNLRYLIDPVDGQYRSSNALAREQK